MKPLIAYTILALHGLSVSCYGVLVQDQSNTVYYEGNTGLFLVPNVNNTHAQVVTTGIAGQLSKIDLGAFKYQGDPGVPLHIDIVKTVGQLPDFAASGRLATRTIGFSDVPNQLPAPAFTLSVDFSADNLQFAAGERFAIMMRSDQPFAAYGWWVNATPVNSYPGGGAYSLHHPTNNLTEQNDAHFRTFVNVPEPSTVAIAASGLFALSLVRRWRPLGYWDRKGVRNRLPSRRLRRAIELPTEDKTPRPPPTGAHHDNTKSTTKTNDDRSNDER